MTRRTIALALAGALCLSATAAVLPGEARAACGWFAVADCTRDGGLDRRAARLGGFASDTAFVEGFTPGWICIMQGPTTKRAARRIRDGFRRKGTASAYIKHGCTRGDVWD